MNTEQICFYSLHKYKYKCTLKNIMFIAIVSVVRGPLENGKLSTSGVSNI